MSETSKKTTKTSKTPPKVEPVAVESTEEVSTDRWRSTASAVFWGVAFIFVGVLLLLDSLGILDVNFFNLWQLWPILVIGAGVSLLSLKGWLAGLVSFLLVVALGFLMWFVAVDDSYLNSVVPVNNQTVTGSASNAKALDIRVKTGATAVELSAGSIDSYRAVLNSPGMRLSEKIETKDTTKHVTLETEMTRRFMMRGGNNSLNLELGRELPLSLRVETGASSLEGDLSELKLNLLEVKAGASSVDLKLGSVQSRLEVKLETGVSRVVLHLPSSVGVRLEADNGLSHTDFEGLNKVSEDTYESTDYSKADKQILIKADLGVSSFEVKRY